MVAIDYSRGWSVLTDDCDRLAAVVDVFGIGPRCHEYRITSDCGVYCALDRRLIGWHPNCSAQRRFADKRPTSNQKKSADECFVHDRSGFPLYRDCHYAEIDCGSNLVHLP